MAATRPETERLEAAQLGQSLVTYTKPNITPTQCYYLAQAAYEEDPNSYLEQKQCGVSFVHRETFVGTQPDGKWQVILCRIGETNTYAVAFDGTVGLNWFNDFIKLGIDKSLIQKFEAKLDEWNEEIQRTGGAIAVMLGHSRGGVHATYVKPEWPVRRINLNSCWLIEIDGVTGERNINLRLGGDFLSFIEAKRCITVGKGGHSLKDFKNYLVGNPWEAILPVEGNTNVVWIESKITIPNPLDVFLDHAAKNLDESYEKLLAEQKNMLDTLAQSAAANQNALNDLSSCYGDILPPQPTTPDLPDINLLLTLAGKILKYFSEGKEKVKTGPQLKSCLIGVQNTFDTFAQLGVEMENTPAEKIGVVGGAMARIAISLCQVNGWLGFVKVTGLAVLSPINGIIMAGGALLNLLFSKDSDRANLENFVQHLQQQVYQMHKEMRASFKIVYKNQLLIFDAVVQGFYHVNLQLKKVLENQDKIMNVLENISEHLKTKDLKDLMNLIADVEFLLPSDNVNSLAKKLEINGLDTSATAPYTVGNEEISEVHLDNIRDAMLIIRLFALHLNEEKAGFLKTEEIELLVNPDIWRRTVDAFAMLIGKADVDWGNKKIFNILTRIKDTAENMSGFISLLQSKQGIALYHSCLERYLEAVSHLRDLAAVHTEVVQVNDLTTLKGVFSGLSTSADVLLAEASRYYNLLRCFELIAAMPSLADAILLDRDRLEGYPAACAFNTAFTGPIAVPRDPKYLDTIAVSCIHYDDCQRILITMRDADGLQLNSYDPISGSWEALPRGPNWSDAASFDQAPYYRTIRVAVLAVDGQQRLYAFCRNSLGILMNVYDPNQNLWTFDGEGTQIQALPDAEGYCAVNSFNTFQMAVINVDGQEQLIFGINGRECFELYRFDPAVDNAQCEAFSCDGAPKLLEFMRAHGGRSRMANAQPNVKMAVIDGNKVFVVFTETHTYHTHLKTFCYDIGSHVWAAKNHCVVGKSFPPNRPLYCHKVKVNGKAYLYVRSGNSTTMQGILRSAHVGGGVFCIYDPESNQWTTHQQGMTQGGHVLHVLDNRGARTEAPIPAVVSVAYKLDEFNDGLVFVSHNDTTQTIHMEVCQPRNSNAGPLNPGVGECVGPAWQFDGNNASLNAVVIEVNGQQELLVTRMGEEGLQCYRHKLAARSLLDEQSVRDIWQESDRSANQMRAIFEVHAPLKVGLLASPVGMQLYDALKYLQDQLASNDHNQHLVGVIEQLIDKLFVNECYQPASEAAEVSEAAVSARATTVGAHLQEQARTSARASEGIQAQGLHGTYNRRRRQQKAPLPEGKADCTIS